MKQWIAALALAAVALTGAQAQSLKMKVGSPVGPSDVGTEQCVDHVLLAAPPPAANHGVAVRVVEAFVVADYDRDAIKAQPSALACDYDRGAVKAPAAAPPDHGTQPAGAACSAQASA